MRLGLAVLFLSITSFNSFADDYSEALLLYQQAQDVLREASGGMPDPVKYANAIKQLEQAEALAEKATAREPDKAERLLQDISGARFWAQKFATTQAASALRGEKITPPPSSPAKPADKGATPPPADAKPATAAPTGDLAEQADQLMRDGKMKETGELWLKALDQLSKDPAGEKKKVALQTRLGNYFFSQGLFNEALKQYQDALAVNERQLGQGNALLTLDLKHVGETLFELAQYKKAEPILLRAVSLAEKFYGTEHAECARIRQLLCKNYILQRKIPLAQAELALVEKIRVKTLKPEDVENAQTLQLNGLFQENIFKLVDARAEYQKALAAMEKARGTDHPSTITYIISLAYVDSMTDRKEESRNLISRALEMAQKALATGHPQIALLQRRMAKEIMEAKPSEAEDLLNKALATNISVYGPDGLQVVFTRLYMEQLYVIQEKYDAAEQECMKAQASAMKLEERGWRSLVMLLNDLGNVRCKQKKFTEAEKCYRQCLQYTQMLGLVGMDSVIANLNMGITLYRDQKRYRDAAVYFQTALDLSVQVAGADAKVTKNIANYGAINLRESGRAKEADALEQKYGVNHR